MSRYIDADNAIERLGAYLMADAQIEYGGMASEDINDWKELATDILKGSPNIDICFCKECKFREANKSIYRGAWYCSNHGDIVDLDDYCSLGERREP